MVRELGYVVGHGLHLAPGEQAGSTLTPALSHGERESYRAVALVGRLREAVRMPNAKDNLLDPQSDAN